MPIATVHGHEAVVKFLLDHGADPHVADEQIRIIHGYADEEFGDYNMHDLRSGMDANSWYMSIILNMGLHYTRPQSMDTRVLSVYC